MTNPNIRKWRMWIALLISVFIFSYACGEKSAFNRSGPPSGAANGGTANSQNPEAVEAKPDIAQPVGATGEAFAASGQTMPKPLTIPNGRRLTVRLLQTVSSKTAAPGQHFDAELASPVVVDGVTVLPRSTPLRGRVIAAHSSGRLHKPGYLRLTLDSIQTPGGRWVGIQTTSISAKGGSHKKRNLALIGGGTGVGAMIGAIAGGAKGAAIGALSGAGAGTAGAYATGKKDVTFPAEHKLLFSTVHEVAIG